MLNKDIIRFTCDAEPQLSAIFFCWWDLSSDSFPFETCHSHVFQRFSTHSHNLEFIVVEKTVAFIKVRTRIFSVHAVFTHTCIKTTNEDI